MKFDAKKWPEYYRQMYLIRRFEEMAAAAYRDTLIRGSLHLYIGEEAIAVGAMATLSKQDIITTSYRNHGHVLARGTPPAPLFAELFGRRTGICKGKGGSMHFMDPERGVIAATAIVAGQIPIAVGAAMAAQSRDSGQVVLTFFGDGATNQGAFHEALNLASVWKAPVVFICENNTYSEMTPTARMLSVEHPVERAVAYRIPGLRVNGNDVKAVFEAVGQGVERARSGEGPTFVEAETYRFAGHMFGDPETYRTPDEVGAHRAADPLTLARQILEEKGVDYGSIESQVESELEQAYAFAEQSPWPDPAEVEEDVYAD